MTDDFRHLLLKWMIGFVWPPVDISYLSHMNAVIRSKFYSPYNRHKHFALCVEDYPIVMSSFVGVNFKCRSVRCHVFRAAVTWTG